MTDFPDPHAIRSVIERQRGEFERLRAENEKLRAALGAIRDLEPRPFDLPADWQEQIRACAECRRWAGHPIQQGICDTHRRPLYQRERHDSDELKALGYRAKIIAREAIEGSPQ